MTDNPFIELLDVVCAELDRQNLMYAITGSVVSSLYGEPCTSQDVDICLNMTEGQAADLANALPNRFYRSESAMREAARRRTITNIVDTDTGLKVDLSVLPANPYFDSVLARRGKVEHAPDGPSFWTVSPEDIILMKLLWRKDTRSRKQWANALSVARMRGARLDWSYLNRWAMDLGVADDLRDLRDAAGI